MGAGASIRSGGKELFQYSHFIPAAYHNSNNVAEYMAFEAILDFLQAQNVRNYKVHICGDSKMVIMQMRGIWRINAGRYVAYANRSLVKLNALRDNHKLSFTLQWIPRGQNGYADQLSKKELINHGVEFRIQPLSLDYQK